MKVKSQKGSIAIFVLVALLFYMGFLLLLYANNLNKVQTISEKTEILKSIYEKNTDNESINEIYAEHKANFKNYQQVEYLESTGTQYIDTGVLLDNNSKVEMNFKYLASSSTARSFGPKNNWLFMFTTQSGGITGKYQNSYGNNWGPSANAPQAITPSTNRHKLTQDKNKFYVDDELNYTFPNAEFKSNNTAIVFGAYYSGSTKYSSMDLYSLKIYDNETLIRDFVPCYRKSDNKPGLYDLVNNEFYTNEGTEEFGIGAEID